PTGGIFYCEPGLREEDRGQLFYTDWGRGILYRYDLKRQGATYVMKQNEWIKSQPPFRAIDLQPDIHGNLYIADWGRSGWGNPQPAGAVIRVSAQGGEKRREVPNFGKATIDELVTLLADPSQSVRLLTQQELIKRGKPALAAL